MIRTTAESMARAPARQPRIAGNGAAPLFGDGAAVALTMPRHRPNAAAQSSTAEPSLRPISRLAALCERPGGVTAVTTVGALLADLPGTATSDMGACLHALCRDLAVCFARPGVPLLSCSTAVHHLPTGTVITLGLIADLLLTNAYTFGFVPPEGGRIAVSFSALETSFELTIDDSALVRRTTARRRGDASTIASLLVAALGGRIETPRVVAGSRCTVILPRHANRRAS